ncbi:hypothetical protein VF21_10425 [Pseudogymnoascus sp. 05NY08]|nr:hypothetical protein VF21_10425 [Pseudogymnoascus sp. 05NY08]
MSGSPPSTPTPSVASSRRAPVVRPYVAPSVEEAPEESDVLTTPVGLPAKPVVYSSVKGWRLAARRPVPPSVGVLVAGPRFCCQKCAHGYYTFPDLQCWVPDSMDSCGDCMNVDNPREALVDHVETLVELSRAKNQALKDADLQHCKEVARIRETYQQGLESKLDALKFLVVQPQVEVPSLVVSGYAALERALVKPWLWKFNTPEPKPVPSVYVPPSASDEGVESSSEGSGVGELESGLEDMEEPDSEGSLSE